MIERLAREVANLRSRVSRLESIPVPRRYPSLLPFATYTLPGTITASTLRVFVGALEPGGGKLVRWVQTWLVVAPNDASNYWVIYLRGEPSGTLLASFYTVGRGTGFWVSTDLDNLGAASTDKFLAIGVSRIGSPGALTLANPLVWLE